MTLVAFGVGNIIGTEIFQPKDAPSYIPGKIAILVLLSVQLFICYLLRWINYRLNKQREAKLAEEKARRGWSDEELQKERERHAFMDLTDKQYVLPPFFPALDLDLLPGICSSFIPCELSSALALVSIIDCYERIREVNVVPNSRNCFRPCEEVVDNAEDVGK